MAQKPPKPVAPPRGDIPVAGAVPTARVPRRGATPAPATWTFSFRFWRQIPFFGLDRLKDVSDAWFVSLLERLAELGTQSVDDARESMGKGGAADGLRFHKIEHEHEHVTMKRGDFDWLDPMYLSDEVTYPICQLHVSRALGRVIGFFDERNVFNVLLLDPLHNLWLSKYADYQRRKCNPLDSHYATLKGHVDRALAHLDGNGDQVARARRVLLAAISERSPLDGITRIAFAVDSAYATTLLEWLGAQPGRNLRAVLEMGITALSD